jgi:hypothetical protein
MPGDELKRFRDLTEKSREALLRLIPLVDDWCGRREEMKRTNDLRVKAKTRFDLANSYAWLTIEKRRQRANAAYTGRQTRFEKIWQEGGALSSEIRATIEALRPVLGSEVDRLMAEANWTILRIITQPESVCEVVQRAKDKVEDYWLACQLQDRAATACEQATLREPKPTAGSKDSLKSSRSQMLAEAQARWRQHIPFAWIYRAAQVDHSDAQRWRSGKLAAESVMTERIEKVLRSSAPPEGENRKREWWD